MRKARLPALAAVVVAFALSACSASTVERPVAAVPKPAISPEMVRLAEMALDDGLAVEARQRYARLAALDPENPWIRLGLAEAMLALDDNVQARNRFEELEDVDAVRARALQGKGLALVRMNRREEAMKTLELAVEADPGLWRAWNALGRLSDYSRDFIRSAQAYDKALALRPDSGVVRNNIGYSCLLQGKPEDAARHLMDALQREPRLEAAQANLRLALALQGRYHDARAGLTKDKLAAGLNNIGFVALGLGDYREAEAFLAQAIEASPSFHDRASANLLRARALKGG